MIADTLPGFRRCMLIRRSVRSPHLELCCLLVVPALHFAAVSAFSQSSSVVLITAGSSCSSFCSILRQPSPVFVSATEHGPYRFAVTLCSVAYEDDVQTRGRGVDRMQDGGPPHVMNTVLPVFNRAGALQISSVRGGGKAVRPSLSAPTSALHRPGREAVPDLSFYCSGLLGRH